MFSWLLWWFKSENHSQKNRAKETTGAEESRMRAERVKALTVSPDGVSYIKNPEDLARFYRNVPEETRRKDFLQPKDGE